MSSCDRVIARIVAAALILAAAAPLAGCIQPLYAPRADGTSVVADLQAVEVDEIPDRIGHYVRNELIYGFNGTGAQVTPRYRLKVRLRERVQTPIYNTLTSFSTSATVVVDAEYSLMTLPDNVEIAKGVAEALASYDRFTARFTNVRGARDAQVRDARVIADSIRTRLAIDLATRQ
jgi:LPS-assembly lipoprotein